jgi:hypothetical protein
LAGERVHNASWFSNWILQIGKALLSHPIRTKKPRLAHQAGSASPPVSPLFLSPFGSLERIDLGFGFRSGSGDMRGHVAVAVFPFTGWFRKSGTVPTGVKLGFALAPVALFHHLEAKAAVVRTTLGGHETAFAALADSFTNHWYLPLFLFEHKKRPSPARPFYPEKLSLKN